MRSRRGRGEGGEGAIPGLPLPTPLTCVCHASRGRAGGRAPVGRSVAMRCESVRRTVDPWSGDLSLHSAVLSCLREELEQVGFRGLIFAMLEKGVRKVIRSGRVG